MKIKVPAHLVKPKPYVNDPEPKRIINKGYVGVDRGVRAVFRPGKLPMWEDGTRVIWLPSTLYPRSFTSLPSDQDPEERRKAVNKAVKKGIF